VLVVVAALAGTAIAEDATTSAKPVTKKKVKKIVAKLAPELSVASAETATLADRAAAADTAGNAGQLDNLDSTAFERSDAVGAGFGNPLVASQEILRATPPAIRVLTDGQTDNDAVVVVENIGNGVLSLRTGPEPGNVVPLDPNTSETIGSSDTTWNLVDEVSGTPEPQAFRIELFAFGNGGSGVLTCFMPQGNPPDYCQFTRGEP
jgi:hypothetical protein